MEKDRQLNEIRIRVLQTLEEKKQSTGDTDVTLEKYH